MLETRLVTVCLDALCVKCKASGSWMTFANSLIGIICFIGAMLVQACVQQSVESVSQCEEKGCSSEDGSDLLGPSSEWPHERGNLFLRHATVGFMLSDWNLPVRKDWSSSRAVYSDDFGRYKFVFRINRKIGGEWCEIGDGEIDLVKDLSGYNIVHKRVSDGVEVKLSEGKAETDVGAGRTIVTVCYGSVWVETYLCTITEL